MKQIAFVVGLIVAGYLLLHFTPAGQRALARMGQDGEVERLLRQAEDQINSTSPKMFDGAIRLDGAKAGPGKRLKYLYTVVARRAAEVDMTVWRNQVAPALRDKIKRGEKLTALFKAGVTVTYRYSGNDGTLIDEIVITPREGLEP